MQARAQLISRVVSAPLLILVVITGTTLQPANALVFSDAPSSAWQLTSASSSPDPLAPFDNPAQLTSYCNEHFHNIGPPSALTRACEFSLYLRSTLPNVNCEQQTRRFQEDNFGDFQQQDMVTATVRYEEGQEQYSRIAIDGKPVAFSTAELSGTWSEGEFATALRAVFLPQSRPEFRFKGEGKLHSAPVLVFEFRIQRSNNHSWYLYARGAGILSGSSGSKFFPGYRGRIWLRQSDSHLLRFERESVEVDSGFPIQRVSTVIDYADVKLPDGTSFVLPVTSESTTCPATPTQHCSRNVLAFRLWHKFAARARVLTADQTEQPGTSPATVKPPERALAVHITPLPEVAFLPSSARGIIFDQRLESLLGQIGPPVEQPPSAGAAGNPNLDDHGAKAGQLVSQFP
jgi:hypothetical protein